MPQQLADKHGAPPSSPAPGLNASAASFTPPAAANRGGSPFGDDLSFGTSAADYHGGGEDPAGFFGQDDQPPAAGKKRYSQMRRS